MLRRTVLATSGGDRKCFVAVGACDGQSATMSRLIADADDCYCSAVFTQRDRPRVPVGADIFVCTVTKVKPRLIVLLCAILGIFPLFPMEWSGTKHNILLSNAPN